MGLYVPVSCVMLKHGSKETLRKASSCFLEFSDMGCFGQRNIVKLFPHCILPAEWGWLEGLVNVGAEDVCLDEKLWGSGCAFSLPDSGSAGCWQSIWWCFQDLLHKDGQLYTQVNAAQADWHRRASHSCGKGGGQLLCCSLLCLAQVRYQMARLHPALCKDRAREQPGLLDLGVVYAGVSLPDFSAWEARQGEVCAALQPFELSEWIQGAWEDSGYLSGQCLLCQQMSLGVVPMPCSAELWVHWQWRREGAYSPGNLFFL